MHLEQNILYFNVIACKADKLEGTDADTYHRSNLFFFFFLSPGGFSEQIYLQKY